MKELKDCVEYLTKSGIGRSIKACTGVRAIAPRPVAYFSEPGNVFDVHLAPS